MRKTRKEYWDEWYAKNKDRERNRQLKHKYGITLEEYQALAKSQEYKCAICNKHESKMKKKLMVDHCHATGRIRGLLCYQCNVAIGLFRDSPESLNKALDYLKTSIPGNSL